MTPSKVHLAVVAMGNEDTSVNDLCRELGITRQTLYRFVSPKDQLRPSGKELLKVGKPRPKRCGTGFLKSAEQIFGKG